MRSTSPSLFNRTDDIIMSGVRLMTFGIIFAALWQMYSFGVPIVKPQLEEESLAFPGNETVSEPGSPLMLLIPKISVTVPIISSQSDRTLSDELTRGVAHLSRTSGFGETGNAIVVGHSANVPWAKGAYNFILKDLNDIERGDEIIINDRRTDSLRHVTYRVIEKRVVGPENPWIFESHSEKNVLTVATCYPIGTTLARLVVRAELVTDKLAEK